MGWGYWKRNPGVKTVFIFSLLYEHCLFVFLDNGYVLQTGNWILGSWWDIVQLLSTLMGVEVCSFQMGNFGNLHGISVLMHLASPMSMVLDMEQRRQWIAIIKLDFSELSAIWIWKSRSMSGWYNFFAIFCFNNCQAIRTCHLDSLGYLVVQ